MQPVEEIITEVKEENVAKVRKRVSIVIVTNIGSSSSQINVFDLASGSPEKI